MGRIAGHQAEPDAEQFRRPSRESDFTITRAPVRTVDAIRQMNSEFHLTDHD
jgi:hypothetical protein